MLHNSNTIAPMTKENQFQVELMCLDLGLQGKYSIPVIFEKSTSTKNDWMLQLRLGDAA